MSIASEFLSQQIAFHISPSNKEKIMPHICLQYSSNIKEMINFKKLFSEMHQLAHQIAGASIESCKSRAEVIDNYYIGDGSKNNAMVHVEVFLLSGRATEIKTKLGEAILALLKLYYVEALKKYNLQITLRIKEGERELYFK